MATKIIVSYDGTDNDQDALALGRLFAQAGASLALAYVRHTHESESDREALAEEEAEQLLEGGAQWLGQPDIERHVVVSPSTSAGLRTLAGQEQADAIVFGSSYRTPAGHVEPGTTAERLLEGGPVALAVAPAGLHDRAELAIATVACVEEDGDSSVTETAEALAARLGASVAARAGDGADLLVVGSRPGTPEGRVTVSAATRYLIETVVCPVLVLPRGVALRFEPAASQVA